MKNLVEVATFDPTITVPEGDDFMDTLAEDLEAVFQALANRTRSLKYFADNAALLIGDAIFAGRITSNNPDPYKSGFRVGNGPHDAVVTLGPTLPSNKWSSAFEAKLTGSFPLTIKFRIYQGDGTEGWVAHTVNAYYDATNAQWKYDNPAQHAFAFMLGGTGTWYAFTYRGSDGWTVWDNLDARLFAHTVAADNLTVTNELDYATTTTRAHRAAMAAATYPAFRDGSGHVVFIPDAAGSYQEISFPLQLPRDAVISEVRVRHNQATSTADKFTLRCRNGDLGSIVYEDVAHADATSTIGTRTTTIAMSPRTVNAAEDWCVVWKLNAVGDPAAVGGNYVVGIEYDLTAPGPRG